MVMESEISVKSKEGLNEIYNSKRQFYKRNRKNFILTVLCQTVFSIASVSISILMMVTLEAIEFTDKKRILLAAILLVSILALYGSFGYLQKIYKNRYMKTALSQFKRHIFEKILGKSIKEFGASTSGRIINAFSNDLASIETHYLDGTLQIIQQCVLFILSVCVMLYLNTVLALCVLGACVVPMGFSLALGRYLAAKERKTSDEGEGFVDQVKDLLNGFILIKSFKAEKEILQLFDKRNFSLEEAKRDRRDTNDSVSLASTFSSILVISMIFTIGLYFAFKGIISIGAIIAFTELSHFTTGPVEKIFPLLSNRKAASGLIDKIAEVIEDKEEPKDKVLIEQFQSAIEMKNVSFSYSPEKTVLKNINLRFEKGKSYAIVGGSGCGKSTLTQLLLGYFTDYQGEIYFDNIRLSDISLDSLYDIISVIQQNVFLFDSTIENNITMFKEFDERDIKHSIELAGLSALIDEKGIDYACGEGGKNLSGGEKQRISIARCLIRKTPVIVMDEATASLDNRTAYEVEDAILNLNGLTKIIVTHKLNQSIIKKYDKIIVLRDGNVVEYGNFDELMANKDYFYSLYNVSL